MSTTDRPTDPLRCCVNANRQRQRSERKSYVYNPHTRLPSPPPPSPALFYAATSPFGWRRAGPRKTGGVVTEIRFSPVLFVLLFGYSALSLSSFAYSLAVGGGGCASFRFRLGPPFLHEQMQPQSPPPPPQKRMQIFRVRTRKVSLLIHQHSGVRACVACESAMGAGSAWCMTAVASGWSGRCNANGICACWDCKSFRFLLRFSSLLVLVEERILIVRSAAALSGCRRAALAQPTTVCC